MSFERDELALMNGCKYIQSSVHIFLASFAIASLGSLVDDRFFLDVSIFRHMLASIPEGPAAPFVSIAALLTISPVILL